ncbi:MAG: epoxyqueuosine reductase QueH [Oscillospiraceae bacterium]|jgi:predicted adenine nucleotide alpha hydrolase (AANH) superfamily ATPase|nr:epoxyqueuosine reductase QueH [Oscillospiraceae bacterium]
MNYQNMLDETISALNGERPSLLLHACCAPCASYCLEYLTKHFDVTVFFYNPNIMPREEYELRLAQFEKLRIFDFKMTEGDYSPGEYLDAVKGREEDREGGARCSLCFRLRLEKTAALAAGSYDMFATTLTISPHKNAEVINGIGAELAEKYAVKWLYADFKKKDGYKRSIRLCRDLGIYRQNYCGCRL